MSISNPAEINAQKSSAGDVPMKSLADKRSYALSLATGASVVLTALGAAHELHVKGLLYGLSVSRQSTVKIHAADHVTFRDFDRYKDQFSLHEGCISISGPQTPTPTDYRSLEGQALAAAFKEAACRLLVVSALSKKDSWRDASLHAFKRAISANTGLSIAIFQGLSKDEEDLLPSYFDEVFMVESCEPDEDFASACMVSPVAGSVLANTGHKPVIENIRMDAGGRIERNCQPCVSPDKLTREIYRLRKEGRSLEEIGAELGFNKSTISRRLSALPFPLRGDRL